MKKQEWAQRQPEADEICSYTGGCDFLREARAQLAAAIARAEATEADAKRLAGQVTELEGALQEMQGVARSKLPCDRVGTMEWQFSHKIDNLAAMATAALDALAAHDAIQGRAKDTPTTPDLIIFDADGTLRRCTVKGQPCPNAPGQWELMPNVKETIAKLQNTVFAIVSNQAGIAYGYLTEAMATRLLYDLGIEAFGSRNCFSVDLCPHAVDAGCDCRKPKPLMLQRAMNLTRCPPGRTLYVGDMESDRRAAENAGCAFMWAKDFFGWKAWMESDTSSQ
jgi:histidinol-phosphate phosphatase family protein